jgi:hypothetical protein
LCGRDVLIRGGRLELALRRAASRGSDRRPGAALGVGDSGRRPGERLRTAALGQEDVGRRLEGDGGLRPEESTGTTRS